MEIRKPKGKNGGKRPGSGRKKGTPNFMTRELKEIARKEAPVLYVLKGATGYKAGRARTMRQVSAPKLWAQVRCGSGW